MKNLKRVFSMALALVILVGMMTMPAAAAEIVNKEAVSITAGMGLFAGADGKLARA